MPQTASDRAIQRPHSKTKLGDPRFRHHDISSRILLDPRFDTIAESKKRKAAEAILKDSNASLSAQNQARNDLYPNVTKCQKTPFVMGNKSSHVDGVPLRKSDEYGSYSFGGLYVCGSVWACPICASRIAQVRSEEVALAFKIWHEMGQENDREHSQVMISLTIPHYADQSIHELYLNFMDSRRTMRAQHVLKKEPNFKPWKVLCDEFGIQGTIAAIETTYGYNGWHPHSHDILFLDRKLTREDLDELRTRLTTAWIKACKRMGVEMNQEQERHMYQKSVHVRNAPTAAEYIAKFGLVNYEQHKDILNPGWGAAQELTKSHIKKSKGDKGFTPWDFLRIIDQFPDDQKIYLKFGRLFREYWRTFFGRRQLFWSKGFKDQLNSHAIYYQTLYISRIY